MFPSNNHINNENGVYPHPLYLPPFSSHGENISAASYNHHLQHHHNQQNFHTNDSVMAAPHNHHFIPESLINHMAFSSNNVMMEQNLLNGGCSDRFETFGGIKKPVKKDRHSKIHTAQGLRDRRVRLSIGIARQFFDLQDMLGFDKASKTLEWLLKKSRKAIKEVVHSKKLNNGDYFNGTGIGYECFGSNIGDEGAEEEDDIDDDDEDEDDDEEKSFASGSSSEYCEETVYAAKKAEIGGSTHREKRKKNELSNISSKGLKGKERERATERAGDKIGSRNTDPLYGIIQSQILDSLMSTSNGDHRGVEKLSASVHGRDMTHSLHENPIEELNRFPGQNSANKESAFINRKIKPSTPFIPSYGHQNGGLILKDQSSSSNNITLMPPNWDNYDQNPFLDPPFSAFSNINMSRGL